MANRRCLSLKIIDSDLFLDMPMSARLLYYDLCMRADDEGFVGNPKKIMRITGASNDDMNILIQKRFVIYCDSGVVVIRQWFIHNYIKPDRFSQTIYQNEKASIALNENKEYVTKAEAKVPEIEEKPKKASEKKYGEFKHVALDDKQYEALKKKYGDMLDEHIRVLDEYCETSGKTYKNYALVIQGWVHEKIEKEISTKPIKMDEKFYEKKEEKSTKELQEETDRIRKEILGAHTW